MKRIAVLGSTGSIGCNTLDIVARFPGKFEIVGLSTNSNIGLLYQQARRFSPKLVAVGDKERAWDLKVKLNSKIKLLAGEEGIQALAQDKNIDLVVIAISGSGALFPLMKAIEQGKTIALANKEALVMAGSIIIKKAKEKNVTIIPIDSEQSAIWQCLEGRRKTELRRVYLTASGGPFKDTQINKLKKVTLKEVLNHPRWKMGKKVTVDSATLMNKGLELLEAMYLFGLEFSQISVLIHPQAIIHSMTEFVDGSILAQLSITDMRVPIQYALSYPERFVSNLPALDFFKLKNLNFSKPDLKKFPCLSLACEAAKAGGTLPCVLNAANEVTIEAFLNGKIDFLSISEIIGKVMHRHRIEKQPNLQEIFLAHGWARGEAERLVKRL